MLQIPEKLSFTASECESYRSEPGSLKIVHIRDENAFEIYDVSRKSVALTKTRLPDLRVISFRQGSCHLICGRQFKIEGYADDTTREWFESQRESSAFLLIKPREYCVMGEIVTCLQSSGLSIDALEMVRLHDKQVLQVIELCDFHESSTFIADVTADVVVALKVSGKDAVYQCNSLVSAWPVYVSKSCMHAERELSLFFGTRNKFIPTAIFSHCALCIVKPHAVNSHSGDVIDTLLKGDFEISAMKLMTLSLNQVRGLLDVYKGVITDFADTCTELASGPCLLIQVRKENVVAQLRTLVGPLDPAIAKHVAPMCLRARLGLDRARNGIHCTDLAEDGIRECEYFFK